MFSTLGVDLTTTPPMCYDFILIKSYVTSLVSTWKKLEYNMVVYSGVVWRYWECQRMASSFFRLFRVDVSTSL